MNKYGILGSGAWGSAISTLIEDGEIIIWTRNIRVMNSINNLQKTPVDTAKPVATRIK